MGDAISQGTFYVGDLLPEAGKPMPKLGADGDKRDRSTSEGPYIPVAATAGDEVATADPGDGSTALDGEAAGLAAFLLDNCSAAAGASHATAANANDVAAAVLAKMRAGDALEASDLITAVQAEFGAFDITASGGADFIEGVLKCLAGYTYTVADETEIGAAGGAFTAASGSFSDDKNRVASQVSTSLSLTKSLASGQLAGFCDASFSYGGETGAALVVYDDDGSVL